MSAVLLVARVVGLVTNPQLSPKRIACSRWLRSLLLANMHVIIPEIADYELRREKMRST